MKRLAAFLGILMVLSFLLACAAAPPDTVAGPQEQKYSLVEKLETFTATGSHTVDNNKSPVHELRITFYRVGDNISATVKCEHGMTIIEGDEADELRADLRNKNERNKPPAAEDSGTKKSRMIRPGHATANGAHRWCATLVAATWHEGCHLLTPTTT